MTRRRRITGRLLVATGLLALLVACTDRPSLTMAEKTRLRGELIDERIECRDHVRKHALPAKNDEELNALYEAAKLAHCLKADV